MKVLDNIGLGLFLFSIVSMVFWSPRPYSISHGLDDAIDKVSKAEQFFVEKAKTIPFKIDFATKDTIGRTKIDIEDSKDLYRNSLTRTNEENVKPRLNEISNWVGVNQDPSITEEHSNTPKEKACEVKVASKEIEKEDLDASYITSNDLEDTTYSQNIELYKQTTPTYDQSNDWVADQVHEVIDKPDLVAGAAIKPLDDWVVDHAHEVFDKSGLVANVVENKVDKIMDTTFQEMDMEKPLNFLNNSVSNIVGSLEKNVCQKNLNESNILHNNLQLLGTNNIDDDVENTTNVIRNNVRLLGVDRSQDFTTENTHKKSQELGEQWDQLPKDTSEDTRLNSIEQSFIGVNNLWSMFVKDAKTNEVKNELNSQKELHNSWNDRESIYDQNENSNEDTKKHHREVRAHQYKHFQGDYDDDTNYEGVKQRIVKYSHGTYEGAQIGANDDYKARKYIQRARNHAHRHYRDARHKRSEFYEPMNDATRNFGKNNQYYNEYDREDDDEDFYEEL